MGKQIKVYVEGIGGVDIGEGSLLVDLSRQVFGKDYKKYLGARINNEVHHLRNEVQEGMYVKF